MVPSTQRSQLHYSTQLISNCYTAETANEAGYKLFSTDGADCPTVSPALFTLINWLVTEAQLNTIQTHSREISTLATGTWLSSDKQPTPVPHHEFLLPKAPGALDEEL